MKEKIGKDLDRWEEQIELMLTEHLLDVKCSVKDFTHNLSNSSWMEVIISFSSLQMRKLNQVKLTN